MIEVIVGQVYVTESGKRLKVTAYHDWADEICGVVLGDNGLTKDYFKSNYTAFCNIIRGEQYV